MNKRVFNFELEGRPVLGFDTGLNARSFAQTKMSLFITQPGYIVQPDGKIETWQAQGVTEFAIDSAALVGQKTMVIWGMPFPAEELSEVINHNDEALDALRYWLSARMALEKNLAGGQESPFSGPAGAFIVTERQYPSEGSYPTGTVFFPPTRLLKRTLDADGVLLNAEQWIHPDLKGPEGISFCAGVMLYRIFCGTPPFTQDKEDELRQDLREGVFIPPLLAAPGLDPEMAALISEAISPISGETKPRPRPEIINEFIGSPFSKEVSSWIKVLGEKEISEIRSEYKQYGKRKASAVKRKRFLARNTAIICVSFAALIVLLLFSRSMIRSRSELPTTRGMTALEVAAVYYKAFNTLDHTMMQSCVSGRAGREDIQMVTSLYVVSRVRQAYERGEFFMPATEWIEAGRPETDKTVFGITDLSIEILAEDDRNAILEADYVLWTQTAQEEGINTAAFPVGMLIKDILYLAHKRNTWSIVEIERTSTP